MDGDAFDCTQVLEQLSEYLDDEAREELCRTIEAHLTRCTDCQVYVDTVKKTILLYQSDRAVEMPVQVGTALQDAMARAYSNEEELRSG